jgi:uncharacterized protein YndB with AHSA1/START domain
MRIIGSLQQTGTDRGSVHVEDVFDTAIEDLWEACTDPERLARWIADVSGDLRVGGAFRARFTSGWEGTGRVEVCEPPRRLVVRTTEDGESQEHTIEATLTPEGDRTVLVIEERGLPAGELAAYGAGWQVHLEDLAASLAGRDRCDMSARWRELFPTYEQLTVG